MLMWLVGFFLAVLLIQRYVSNVSRKDPEIESWQHGSTVGRRMNETEDTSQNTLSFCKGLEQRTIQVMNNITVLTPEELDC